MTMDFRKLSGVPSMVRVGYRDAVLGAEILSKLAKFDPRIVGTPPLGLDLPASDIDVLCHAPDPDHFASSIWLAFGACDKFRIWQWSGPDRPVLAEFLSGGWRFEIFGQAKPVELQLGWRHFAIERRLLALGGDVLAAAVMAFRRNGHKTEPAFAKTLGLPGDPYEALLDLEGLDDNALALLIEKSSATEVC